MYDVIFRGQAKNDYKHWAKHNKAIRGRIDELIKDMLQHPFEGLGSPKPLKGDLHGCWRRKITGKHRLVYSVSGNVISIFICRWHYEKE